MRFSVVGVSSNILLSNNSLSASLPSTTTTTPTLPIMFSFSERDREGVCHFLCPYHVCWWFHLYHHLRKYMVKMNDSRSFPHSGGSLRLRFDSLLMCTLCRAQQPKAWKLPESSTASDVYMFSILKENPKFESGCTRKLVLAPTTRFWEF